MAKDEGRTGRPPTPRALDPPAPNEDALAKDILDEQPTRRTPGERLSRRVGRRRFERAPIVSCTGRLFERYDIADPWDPDSKDSPLAVGPVGMRFEERRQPAPHARVKDPNAKKKNSDRPAWTPPKGIPDARGAKKPDPAPAAAAIPRPSNPVPQAPQPVPVPDEAPPPQMPPVAPPPRGKLQKKAGSGRFRMRPTSTSAPRVRQVQRAVEHRDDADKPAPEPQASPPPAPQSLDDLFGSLGAGGRDKRVGKKKDS